VHVRPIVERQYNLKFDLRFEIHLAIEDPASVVLKVRPLDGTDLTNEQITHFTNIEDPAPPFDGFNHLQASSILPLESCILGLESSTSVENALQITPFYAKQTQSCPP